MAGRSHQIRCKITTQSMSSTKSIILANWAPTATKSSWYQSAEKEDVQTKKTFWGRWKRKSFLLNIYDNIELPFFEENIVRCLCMGGSCIYIVKQGNGVREIHTTVSDNTH